MPHLIITDAAALDLQCCRNSLADKAPLVAERVGGAILDGLVRFKTTPHIGRPVFAGIGLRELSIPVGDAGYVALYRDAHLVYVLAVRHTREVGYQ